MKLQKCPACGEYNLTETCKNPNCKKQTKSAHYKFLKTRSLKKDSEEI